MYEIKYRDESTMKDSGVIWVGKIPQDWMISKIKFEANIFGRIGFRGYTVNDIVDEGEGAISLSPSNIIDQKIKYDKKTYLSWKKYDESPEIKIKNGDVLLVKTASIGKTAFVEGLEEKATINPQLIVFKKIHMNSKLFYYFIESDVIQEQVKYASNGGVVSTLTQSDISNFRLLETDRSEQQKIANFLDIKTNQFDSIIAKKEQLIKKLEEAKKSLISEVVTGKVKIVDGQLEPRDASEMKASGVEWLGMVPKEWTVEPFKHCFKVRNGKEILDEKKDINKPISVYGSGGVFKCTSHVIFDGESVLFGRKGTIGKPLHVTGKFWTVDTMYFTIFYELFYPKFFYYQLTCYPWSTITTSTALPSVVGSDVGNSKTIVPNFSKMKQLSDYLDEMFITIDSTIELTNEQIRKLKQAKQSLISEAVTGKFDLRDWEIIEEGELQ